MVDWTDGTLGDLREIEARMRLQSPASARRLVERIFARADLLLKHPKLGPMVAEFEDEGLRELFEKPFRFVYRVEADGVKILTVFHSARDVPRDP